MIILLSDDASSCCCSVHESASSPYLDVESSPATKNELSQDNIDYDDDEPSCRTEEDCTESDVSDLESFKSTSRRVHFASTLRHVRPVPHFSELTPEERRLCWNTQEDAVRILRENRALVEKVGRGISIDEEMESLRGLEKQLRGNRPSHRYQETMVVVLEAQHEFGYDDCEEEEDRAELEEMIASLYQTISEESALEACSVGQRDWADALR